MFLSGLGYIYFNGNGVPEVKGVGTLHLLAFSLMSGLNSE